MSSSSRVVTASIGLASILGSFFVVPMTGFFLAVILIAIIAWVIWRKR